LRGAYYGSDLDGLDENASAAHCQNAPSAFEAYSRFDFVPGEKLIAVEDFAQDSIGDFPAKWNTNASGEVVTVANRPGRWLKLAGKGVFVPEFLASLPENFTLEYDMFVAPRTTPRTVYTRSSSNSKT